MTTLRPTPALRQLLWSQIEDRAKSPEAGMTVYRKLQSGDPAIDLTEPEVTELRAELTMHLDGMDFVSPGERATARAALRAIGGSP